MVLDMSDLKMGAAPEQGEAQWLRLVEKALGGAPLEKLQATLDTGETAHPLYTPRDGAEPALASGHPGAAPFIRAVEASGAGRWRVMQAVDMADPAAANAQALEDLGSGADGLWLQLPGSLPLGGGCLGVDRASDVARVLADVPLARTPIYVCAGANATAAAAVLLTVARGEGVAPGQISGSLGLDPLSAIAQSAEAPVRDRCALADAVDAALFASGEGLAMTPFLASGRLWHQAGGSAVEELACTLAAAVSYWRALAELDVPLEDAAGMIGFHLIADADVFLTIAKFRAARALWARATGATGIAPQPAHISAEMSYRTMSARDAYTNLLRASAAGFAAAAGGANAVVLAPFTAAAGMPDGFARRLARNTQIILAEESGLGRVTDAAGGSWYGESLTHDLAAQAWAAFQEIEASGGLLAALRSGLVARRLQDVRARREAEINRRDRAITGVSTYPMLDEKSPPLSAEGTERVEMAMGDMQFDLPPANRGERMAAIVAAAEQGARISDLSAELRQPCEPIPPLPDPVRRDAQGFEELRAACDIARDIAGVRPSVFLANVGALAAFTDRATWARNFFEAGGITGIMGTGAGTTEELAQEFRDSGASIACLCGRDEDYGALAGAAEALRDAGADAIYVAGTPATLDTLAPADSRATQRLLYDGCDALGILREAHRILKVEEVIASARKRAGEEALTGWAQTERT